MTPGLEGPALAAAVVTGVGAVVAGRGLAARLPWAVPLAVVVAPLMLASLPGRSLFGDGVTGYANASGALYFLAAAGAVTLALRSSVPRRRHVAAAGAVAWGLAVLLLRVDTLLLFVGLLGLGVFVRGARASRTVLAVGLAAAAGALTAAVVLGLAYEPGPRIDAVSQVVDATMGPTRVVMWHEAVEAVREDPATGKGLGSFGSANPISDGDAFAHNEILEVAAETGLAGGVLVAALLVWGFAWLWHSPLPRSAFPAVAGLVGVAVQANVDYVLHFPSVVLALGALVGTATRLPAAAADREPPPAARLGEPTLTAVAGTLVAVFVLSLPSPLNPPQTVANGAQLVSDPPGVRFTGGVVRSTEPPHDLYRALTAEPGLTVELRAATADLDQEGPARLVSSSGGTGRRNLTLGQAGDALVIRLRTLQTNWNATDAQVEVDDVFTDTRRHHLAVVRHGQAHGQALEVYVDGELRNRTFGPAGSFSDWNFNYPLLLGNEVGGRRPWRGSLETVAFYGRALPAEEVRQAFRAGPDGRSDAASVAEKAEVARYEFARASGRAVEDTSTAGFGPPLAVPARRPGSSDGFVSTFLAVDRLLTPLGVDGEVLLPATTAMRVTGHLVLFAVPAVLAARAAGPRWPAGRVVTGLIAGGFAVALLLSIARHLGQGAPSVLDVAAAVAGTALGAGVWVAGHARGPIRGRTEA